MFGSIWKKILLKPIIYIFFKCSPNWIATLGPSQVYYYLRGKKLRHLCDIVGDT